jgi:hypothetical protein
MSPQPTSSGIHTGRDILARVSIPLFLFSAVLLFLLLLSWFLILPLFSRVDISGETLSLWDAKTLLAETEAEIAVLEKERHDLIIPVHDQLFASLVTQKHRSVALSELLKDILSLSASLIPHKNNVVALSTVDYLEKDHEMILEGVIHNVGPRSMTVLASFLTQIETIPAIVAVSLPVFERVQTTDGSYESPFQTTLRLSERDYSSFP